MTHVPVDYDAAIVGGGLAGLAGALSLAHAGLNVVVIDTLTDDAQSATSFDGRASAIAYANMRMLDRLGVGERLRPDAQRIEKILVTDGRLPDGARAGGPGPFWLRFDAAETHADGSGEALGFMVENRRMRQALLAAIATRPGVTRITGVQVTGVSVTPAAARVELDDGRALTARLAVGADGARSLVRDAVGVRVQTWDYGQSGIVATVRHERPHNAVAHEFFLPSGPFAILPLTDDRASLVWTERTRAAEAAMALNDRAFLAEIRQRFGDFLGDLSLEGPRFAYPLGVSIAERFIAPRLVLIGDAARRIHPIAGQGFNLGLKDAAALRDVVAEAVTLGLDPGAETALAPYEAWRRFDSTVMALAADGFTRLYSNDVGPLRAARGLAMAAVNALPWARRAFTQAAGADLGETPSLLRA